MRILTIQRTLSYVDAFRAISIYIEDSFSGDTTINGILCRRIGELENGEKKIFEIDETKSKIFVVPDGACTTVREGWCQLPDGEKDIYLQGCSIVDSKNGSDFRFDHRLTQGIPNPPKRKSHTGIIVLASLLCACVFVGVVVTLLSHIIQTEAPKTFKKRGMSITLTDEFQEVKDSGYTAAYVSEEVEVIAKRRAFSDIPEWKHHSTYEYAYWISTLREADAPVMVMTGNVAYFTYVDSNEARGERYHYTCCIYKTKTSFWVIQFGVPTAQAASYKATIEQWASSVEFSY